MRESVPYPTMATIECKSAQPNVPSVWVEVGGITDDEVATVRNALDQLLESETQVSTAVARALVDGSRISPRANPSDLWQHVIYRHLLNMGWSDNRWKRVSGFALERALVAVYEPRLAPYGLRMRDLSANEANRFLATLDVDIRATKVDLFLEGETAEGWRVFGAAHVKASIAERIQDDVPASQAFMAADLVSTARQAGAIHQGRLCRYLNDRLVCWPSRTQAFANSQVSGSNSNPTNRCPSIRAALPVVPLPMNGSQTIPPPSTAAPSMQRSGRSSGNVEQWGVRFGVWTSFQTDPTGGFVRNRCRSSLANT